MADESPSFSPVGKVGRRECAAIPVTVHPALLRLTLALLAAAALGAGPADAQLLKPDAHWRTFDSEHFRVTYSDGLEDLARRATARAEEAYAVLALELLPPPTGRIELVLADNVDYANGVATPFPRNRIVVYAHPPASESYLTNYEDWLEIVVLHELVHIFHLSQSEGVWPAVRRVLGRNPVAFPHAFTPGWLLEGLATYAESRFTGAGRVEGSMYQMILRTAALEGGIPRIDRVTLDPATWPGGISRYLFGAFFIDHLARRHGEKGVSATVESVGSQLIPYRLDHTARGTLGTSLSAAWDEWADSLTVAFRTRAESLRAHGITEPEVLTSDGRIAEHPRYGPTGALVFAASSGRAEPGIMVLAADGSVSRLANLAGLGPPAWSRGGERLIHAQLEFTDPHSVHSDIFERSLDGRTRRVTRGARVWEPDPHPEGETAIAVGSALGTNVLVSVDLRTGDTRQFTERDPDTQWSGPRWSPDGDRIAVSRWAPGSRSDIVILDSRGAEITRVTSDDAVDSYPGWSPDGRFLLFSSDRTGIPNLFAFDVDSGTTYQVTNVLTGAFHPDVSPDGRWIAFSYYRSDGFHIARIPFEPQRWRVAAEGAMEAASGSSEQVHPYPARVEGGSVRAYSAWPTVLPTWWSPAATFGSDVWTGIGLTTGGRDVIERHRWALDALAYPGRRRLDLDLLYRYRGLGNPELLLRVGQDWAIQARERSGDPSTARPELARRVREFETALSWTSRRWRRVGWLQGGVELRDVDYFWGDPVAGQDPRPDIAFPLDGGAFVALGLSTLRRYELSLSSQEGLRSSLRVQGNRYLRPSVRESVRRNYWRVTTRNAAFRGWDVFGFAPSIFALRVDAGVETSDVSPGFTLGGVSGSSAPLPIEIGSLGSAVSYPLRGYAAGVQRGNRVLSASAEYRFPIVLLERGYRLWPVAVDRVWGNAFVDAGAAWCRGACGSLEEFTAAPEPLVSAGGEAIVELDIGYGASLPIRGGVAVPLTEGKSRRPSFYLHFGVPF